MPIPAIEDLQSFKPENAGYPCRKTDDNIDKMEIGKAE